MIQVSGLTPTPHESACLVKLLHHGDRRLRRCGQRQQAQHAPPGYEGSQLAVQAAQRRCLTLKRGAESTSSSCLRLDLFLQSLLEAYINTLKLYLKGRGQVARSRPRVHRLDSFSMHLFTACAQPLHVDRPPFHRKASFASDSSPKCSSWAPTNC